MRNFLIPALTAMAVALPLSAGAAGGESHIEDVSFSFEGPFGTYDRMQLQRGFQVFNEVCSGCHGLKYLAFRNLGDPGGPEFPPEQVQAIAGTYEVFDASIDDMRTALPSDKFPENTAVGAPDLTLMAKARVGYHGPYGSGISQFFNGIGGPEYIYSILTGYDGEEHEMAGAVLYGNHTMPGGMISMAQPLYGDDVEYAAHGGGDDHGEDHGGGHEYTPPQPTLEQEAEDVAAFLMWAAEPKMMERKAAGVRNVAMLIVLAVLLYFTNKKLWAPVKREH